MKKLRLSLLFLFCCLGLISSGQNERETSEQPPVPVPAPAAENAPPKRAYRGKRQGRYGFYTSSEWVIPNIYDELPKKYSDFMIAKKENKYGIIDRLNQEILPFKYKSITTIYSNYKKKIKTGYYIIDTGQLKGIIDQKGTIIIPAIYPYLQSMQEDGYIVGNAEGLYGLFTTTGGELHPLTLESKPTSAHDNHFSFKKNGKFGVLNRKGKVIIPFEYDALKFFNYSENKKDQFYSAQLDGKFGIIDTKEKVIIPYEYEDIRQTTYNRLLSVQKDQQYGILDRDGKTLIPTEYDYIKQYSDNFYVLKNDEKYGLANHQGKEIIPIEYERIERKSLRYMIVEKDRKKGIMDTLGNLVLDFNYRKIRCSNDKIIFAAKYGEEYMAVYNEKGEQVKPPVYYEAEKYYHYSVVRKSQSGKRALFDNNSLTELTPFQYDRIKVKKDRKQEGQFIITGWKGDSKIQISVDGQEVGSPSISRAAIEKERQAQKKALLDKKLSRSKWQNLITVKGKKYLQQLDFYNSESGSRKIYFFSDDQICFVEQTFKLIPSDRSSYYLKMTSYPIQQVCRSKTPPEGLVKSGEVMGLETLNIYADYDKVLHIRNYQQVKPGFEYTLEALKESKQLIGLAQELAAKIEGRPGGLSKPYLSIDPKTKEVKVHSQYGSVDNVAFLDFKDEQLILKTEFWEKEAYYSLAGIWRNVTYIDQNGNIKTGDLDLCFVATKPQKYWLREAGK